MDEQAGGHDGYAPVSADLERAANAIIGAAIEVHRHLGAGLLESTYEAALVHELALCGLPVRRQVRVTIRYKGVVVGEQKLDLVVEPGVIVELKSVAALAEVHGRQVVSYLKASGLRLGLLINFNVPLLRDGVKRFVN